MVCLKQYGEILLASQSSVHWGSMRLHDYLKYCYAKTTLYCINNRCQHIDLLSQYKPFLLQLCTDSFLAHVQHFTLWTMLDPLYFSKAISITSFPSISICHNCSLLINTSDHSTAFPLFTPSITLGLPSYHKVIRLTLNWMKSQYNLGFILLDNRIIIDYVVNWNYILQPVKQRQIQVNCLLNQIYEFK